MPIDPHPPLTLLNLISAVALFWLFLLGPILFIHMTVDRGRLTAKRWAFALLIGGPFSWFMALFSVTFDALSGPNTFTRWLDR